MTYAAPLADMNLVLDTLGGLSEEAAGCRARAAWLAMCTPKARVCCSPPFSSSALRAAGGSESNFFRDMKNMLGAEPSGVDKRRADTNELMSRMEERLRLADQCGLSTKYLVYVRQEMLTQRR